LARQHNAVAIIRGLRAVSDFEYEMTMAGTNRRMYPDCDTISFMPSEQYMFISSRLVKEIAILDGDVAQFVPELVVRRLKERVASNRAVSN
jgi:pantetheine-phosphate adenylyltransferase